LTQNLADAPLVVRVGVGVQQADRNSLDPLGFEPRDRALHASEIEWRDHLAAWADALLDLKAKAAWHQRLRLDVKRLVKTRHANAAQFEHIAEAARGDERGLGPLMLDDGVGRHR